MTVVNTFVKESNAAGNRLEAQVLTDDIGYKVRYYVNGSFKSEATFGKSMSVSLVEKHAKDWLNEVHILNG